MDILFATKKFMKQCDNRALLIRAHGPRCADLIRKRLDEMRAADSLQILRFLPQARCHELKGNLAGCFSVDLEHPFRLIFRPANKPIPKKPDGGLDWESVTAVEIIRVEDTHG